MAEHACCDSSRQEMQHQTRKGWHTTRKKGGGKRETAKGEKRMVML